MPKVCINLRGGLGNRLFVAAAAHGIAATTGRDTLILSADPSAHSGRTYVDTVFSDFDCANTGTQIANTVEAWEPANRCLAYDGPLANTTPANASIVLNGYFQNERYFEGHGPVFVRRLRLPAMAAEIGTLFIHVRRGDYLLNHFHAVDLSGYFRRAVALAVATFGSRLRRLLAFSDDPQWCRQHMRSEDFANVEIEVANESDEERALARMAACELGGICANSSFSWWGAYIGVCLRPSADKLITFPSKWFNHPPSADVAAGVYVDDVAFKGAVRVAVEPTG